MEEKRMRSSPSIVAVAICVTVCRLVVLCGADGNNGIVRAEEQPLVPGGGSNTIPALPVVQQQQQKTCRLDLSDELFGGVEEACGKGKTLDRSRCCPVLAAWLYAAHARTALQPAAAPAPVSSSSSDLPLPLHPEDSQTCVNALEASLNARGIHIPRPNATCDAILCFCGIRLHQLTSLNCPATFNLTKSTRGHQNYTTPTPAARSLEANCTDPSYKGCTKCLRTLDKLKDRPGKEGSYSERTSRMYRRDCELMGLTWLLAKNKTAYIPTVSAVLRAVMYSNHPPRQSECSPDQENMPLAVNTVQLYQSSAAAAVTSRIGLLTTFFSVVLLLFL